LNMSTGSLSYATQSLISSIIIWNTTWIRYALLGLISLPHRVSNKIPLSEVCRVVKYRSESIN
jgi:hypothetical protein